MNSNNAKLIGKRLGAFLERLPLLIFVRFGAVLNLVTVVVVALVAAALIWQLLYREPRGVVGVPGVQPQLATEAIDRLEYWIEAREEERKQPLALPGREFFRARQEN